MIMINNKNYAVHEDVSNLLLQVSKERDHYENMLRQIQDILAADLNIKIDGEEREGDTP